MRDDRTTDEQDRFDAALAAANGPCTCPDYCGRQGHHTPTPWWNATQYRCVDEACDTATYVLSEEEFCCEGVDVYEVEPSPEMVGDTIYAMADNGYKVTRFLLYRGGSQ